MQHTSEEGRMSIKIVLADDSDLVMVGLRTIIENDNRYIVVGNAQNFNNLLKLIEQQQPSIAILGENLYDTDILTTVDVIHRLSPKTRIIIIGMTMQGSLLHVFFMRGVKAYLYRSDPLCECLLTAIYTIIEDRPFLSPTANAEYLIALQSGHLVKPLDEKSRKVLTQLAQGISINQIALHLGLPPRRVYAIRDRLRRRFGVDTNEHLISRAVAEGFTNVSAL